MPDNPSLETLKKMRMGSEASVQNVETPPSEPETKGKARVTIEDAMDEDEDRSFAPGGDADYFIEEDEDGRFFGGGLTSEQKDILNIFELAGDDALAEVSLQRSDIRGLICAKCRVSADRRTYYNWDPQDLA